MRKSAEIGIFDNNVISEGAGRKTFKNRIFDDFWSQCLGVLA